MGSSILSAHRWIPIVKAFLDHDLLSYMQSTTSYNEIQLQYLYWD